MAVGMVLAMVGLIVMPAVSVGDLYAQYRLYEHNPDTYAGTKLLFALPEGMALGGLILVGLAAGPAGVAAAAIIGIGTAFW